MTRRYDQKLRGVGISVVQFSVLMVVRECGEETITAMAKRIAMDRSTLSRNLDILERNGLIVARKSRSHAGRSFDLTSRGDEILERVIPLWQAAQSDFNAILSPEQKRILLGNLKHLTAG